MIMHDGQPLFPERGQYVVTYVTPEGDAWAAVHVTREFFESAVEPGIAVTKMLDDKIELMKHEEWKGGEL
jgi:hypothetical protein